VTPNPATVPPPAPEPRPGGSSGEDATEAKVVDRPKPGPIDPTVGRVTVRSLSPELGAIGAQAEDLADGGSQGINVNIGDGSPPSTVPPTTQPPAPPVTSVGDSSVLGARTSSVLSAGTSPSTTGELPRTGLDGTTLRLAGLALLLLDVGYLLWSATQPARRRRAPVRIS